MKKLIILNFIDIMVTIILVLVGVFTFYVVSHRANSFILHNFFFPLISIFVTFFLGINTGTRISKARDGEPVGLLSKIGFKFYSKFNDENVIDDYHVGSSNEKDTSTALEKEVESTKEETNDMRFKKDQSRKVDKKYSLFEEKETDDFVEERIFKEKEVEEDVFDDIKYEEKTFDKEKPKSEEQPSEPEIEEVQYAEEEIEEVKLVEEKEVVEEVAERVEPVSDTKEELPAEFTINKDDYF